MSNRALATSPPPPGGSNQSYELGLRTSLTNEGGKVPWGEGIKTGMTVGLFHASLEAGTSRDSRSYSHFGFNLGVGVPVFGSTPGFWDLQPFTRIILISPRWREGSGLSSYSSFEVGTSKKLGNSWGLYCILGLEYPGLLGVPLGVLWDIKESNNSENKRRDGIITTFTIGLAFD